MGEQSNNKQLKMARGCCLAPIALSFHPNPSTSLKVLRLLENDQVTPEEVE